MASSMWRFSSRRHRFCGALASHKWHRPFGKSEEWLQLHRQCGRHEPSIYLSGGHGFQCSTCEKADVVTPSFDLRFVISLLTVCSALVCWALFVSPHQYTDVGKQAHDLSSTESAGKDLEARLMYVRELPCDQRIVGALVKIRDARPLLHAGHLSLYTTGMTLVYHNTTLSGSDFTDDKLVSSTYYREICKAIQEETGAEFVLAFHHLVRSSKLPHTCRSEHDDGPIYDTRVHSDYTEESADAVFRWQLQAMDPSGVDRTAYHQGRYLLINAWRNINDRQPIVTPHLAVCDGSSLEMEDLICDISSDENVSYTSQNFPDLVKGPTVKHTASTKHRWLYFPCLEKSELLLFKCFDSDTSAPSRFAIHCAFTDPTASSDAALRESIEVRAIAFFPEDSSK